MKDGDACSGAGVGGVGAAALDAAIEDVDGAAVEREDGVDGVIEAGLCGAVGNGDDAVDGEIDGLAVDEASGRGLIGVQLDDAVEGVGVTDHREHDGVTRVDEDLIDVGKVERVRGVGDVIEDDQLARGLVRGVDVIEADRNGDRVGCGTKTGYGSAGLFGVVDIRQSSAGGGGGIDEARDLLRKVVNHAGKGSGEATDGEGGVGVEDGAADVTLGVEHLQRTRCAVGDADHDAVGELAGRNGPVSEGELGELVVPLAAGGEAQSGNGDHEAAEDLGTKRLGYETSILQREQLQNLSAAVCFFAHCYTAEYNKGRARFDLQGSGEVS